MLLKSVNRDPIGLSSAAQTVRATSVPYSGPSLVGAVVTWRARFNALVVNVGASVRIGVRVPRLSSTGQFQSYSLPAVTIGDKTEAFGSMLTDLIDGDLIELGMSSASASVWELEPFGFSVDIS